MAGFETRLIDLAQQVNNYMPEYVISKISDVLNRRKLSINLAKVLLIGVSYKKDVGDTRESPALAIISLLRSKGARVFYFDPHVPSIEINGKLYKSIKLTRNNLLNKDCIVVITDHSDINYQFIRKNAKLIFDTRNVYKKNFDNIKKL